MFHVINLKINYKLSRYLHLLLQINALGHYLWESIHLKFRHNFCFFLNEEYSFWNPYKNRIAEKNIKFVRIFNTTLCMQSCFCHCSSWERKVTEQQQQQISEFWYKYISIPFNAKASDKVVKQTISMHAT